MAYVRDYDLINSIGTNFDEIWKNCKLRYANHVAYKKYPNHIASIDINDNIFLQTCESLIENILVRNNINNTTKTLFAIGACDATSPILILRIVSNNNVCIDTHCYIYSALCKRFGFNDELLIIGSGCASGQIAIDTANSILTCNDEYDNAIVLSYNLVNDIIFGGFKALDALAPIFCDPFNQSNGLSIGEAIGVMLLDKKLGKTYISQSKITNDAYHVTSPELSANTKMQMLKCFNSINSNDCIIHPHATGTQKNDLSEKTLLNTVPNAKIALNKCLFGHCLGVSGLINCMLASLNVLEDYNNSISLCYAFGGINSAIMFSKHANSMQHKNCILKTKYVDKITSYADIFTRFGISEFDLRKNTDLEKMLIAASIKIIADNKIVLDDTLGCIVILDNNMQPLLLEYFKTIMTKGIKYTNTFSFISSVYSTIVGQIMLKHKMHGYNLLLINSSENITTKIIDANYSLKKFERLLLFKVTTFEEDIVCKMQYLDNSI